jgi:ABC-2 type transport system permease protein
MTGPGFFNVLRWELSKLARRRSSYVGFALCTVFCVAVIVGFYWSTWRGLRTHGRDLGVDPVSLINGPFYASYVLLIGVFAVLPLLGAAIAGNQLAGEARDGTLRLLLTRPISRMTLYWAKLTATYLWVQLVAVFLLVLGLVLGLAIYGGGPMLVYVWDLRAKGVWIIEPAIWLWLLPLACVAAVLSLLVVLSIAMMVSAISDAPATAYITSIGVYLISLVLQRLPGDLVPDELRELLPTTHMRFWQQIYVLSHPTDRFDVAQFVTDIAWCLGFSAVFLAVGAIVFRMRDITA